MNIELEQLRLLPVADKLRIIEQLWDDIEQSNEPLLLAESHVEAASRHARELEADPSIALTREQLWKRVDGFHG